MDRVNGTADEQRTAAMFLVCVAIVDHEGTDVGGIADMLHENAIGKPHGSGKSSAGQLREPVRRDTMASRWDNEREILRRAFSLRAIGGKVSVGDFSEGGINPVCLVSEPDPDRCRAGNDMRGRQDLALGMQPAGASEGLSAVRCHDLADSVVWRRIQFRRRNGLPSRACPRKTFNLQILRLRVLIRQAPSPPSRNRLQSIARRTTGRQRVRVRFTDVASPKSSQSPDGPGGAIIGRTNGLPVSTTQT